MDLNSESDEREGRPSASAIEQMKLCPGSWKYQQLLPQIESSEASEGTTRHDLIEQVIRGKLSLSDVDDDQQHECCKRALDLLQKIETEIEVGWADLDNQHQWLEERVWVHDGAKKLYSAKYDLLRDYGNGTFLLVDWKTLFGDHTPAQENVQLLAQALAVYRNSPSRIKRIYCALAEPFPSPTYSLVEYTTERLEQAFEFIQTIVTKAEKDDANRIPGLKQCKYCDALAICPESRMVISKAFNLNPVDLDSEILAEAMNIASLAEKWAKAVKERTRQMIGDGEEVFGWKLRGSGTVRSIDSADACAKRLMETNQLSWSEFLSANKTSWSGLIKAWKAKRMITRDEAVSELESILVDIVKERPKSEALVKA